MKTKNTDVPPPPKRAGNSFIHFQNEKRSEVKAENPDMNVKGFF
jgi:hypothetical protein